MPSLTAFTAPAQATVKILAGVFRSAITIDLITLGASLASTSAGQAAIVNALLPIYGAQTAGIATSTPTFSGYAAGSTATAFATTLVDSLTFGTSISTTTKAAWVAVVVGVLPGFTSRGAAAIALMNLIDTYTGTDPNLIAANSAMDNRAEASATFAMTTAGATFSSITNLVNTVAAVTNSAASVPAAPSGMTFTLTTGIDNASGTSGNDYFLASGPNHHAELTGGAGADTFSFSGSSLHDLLSTSLGAVHITDFSPGTDRIRLINSGGPFTSMVLASEQTIASADNLGKVYLGITAIGPSVANGPASGVVVNVSAGPAAGRYLYVNDGAAAVSSVDDMLINITGILGPLATTDFVFN